MLKQIEEGEITTLQQVKDLLETERKANNKKGYKHKENAKKK